MTHMFVLCDSLNLLGTSSILFPFRHPPGHLLAPTDFGGTCCCCTCAISSCTSQVEINGSGSYCENSQCGMRHRSPLEMRSIVFESPISHSIDYNCCYQFRLQGSEFSLQNIGAMLLWITARAGASHLWFPTSALKFLCVCNWADAC